MHLLWIAVLIIGWRFNPDINPAVARPQHGSILADTHCDPIEYLEKGAHMPLLIVHGAGSGFDQGMADPVSKSC